MNRKERRAAVARAKTAAPLRDAPRGRIDTAGLLADATAAYRQGQFAQAEVVSKQILAQAPAHAAALNLLGLIHHASGRHRLAVKTFTAALAADPLDAASHYNIAASYQALEQREAAAEHFRAAIALGLNGRDVEQFLLTSAVVGDYVRRLNHDRHRGLR